MGQLFITLIALLTRPRSLIVEALNVQTGPELLEERSRQPLGEDVGVLCRRRDVHDTDITKSNTLPHEVKIDLDVLGALMLDGVGGHVDSADIITIYHRGAA